MRFKFDHFCLEIGQFCIHLLEISFVVEIMLIYIFENRLILLESRPFFL